MSELVASAARPASVAAGPPDLEPEIVSEFVVESTEQLAGCDARLLELEKNPSSLEALNAAFRCFHTIKGLASFLGLKSLQETAHAAEDLLDRARAGRLRLAGAAIDLVFQATGVLGELIRNISQAQSEGVWPPVGSSAAAPLVSSIRTLLEQRTSVAPGAAAALRPETLRPETSPGAISPAALPAESLGAGPGGTPSVEIEATIRVESERLDQLVDVVGELVITASMLRAASQRGEAGIAAVRELLAHESKLMRELRERAEGLRLVPVQGLFRKIARLTTEAARTAGKRVALELSGEETELDKSIVEKIADPLVHLVRNAVDHGLEKDPSERLRLGKPERGRVWLRALHKSGGIHIEVEDDGRGLNRQAIVEKAIQRGLLVPGDAPSDARVFALICEPGFSTASSVTALSGRGVGMDVVKRNIEAVGGVLEISSRPGVGTRFSMRLPLTMAVIDGMLVRTGGELYVIPTLAIRSVLEAQPGDIVPVIGGREMLDVRGELVPLLRLAALFNLPDEDPGGRLAIVTETEGRWLALLVDELVGQQQSVIRSLGGGVTQSVGVSGCAILADGRLGMVLDIAALPQLADAEPRVCRACGHALPRPRAGAARVRAELSLDAARAALRSSTVQAEV